MENGNKTDQYMKQNRLTLNEEKTELMVFRKKKLPIIETVDFKGHRLKASEKFRYLGVIIDRGLTYQNQLNKVIRKMVSKLKKKIELYWVEVMFSLFSISCGQRSSR